MAVGLLGQRSGQCFEKGNITMDSLNKIVKELRETLGKMEVALGSINEAIVWTDEQGVIQWGNTLFDRLVSQPHIHILGKNLTKLLALQKEAKDISFDDHPFNICIKNRRNIHEIYEFNHSGNIRILEITMSLISLGNEKNTYIVTSMLDITKRREYENMLIQQKEELGRINVELLAFQEAAIGREERIVELKQKVNELTEKLGGQPPYDLSFIEKI